MKTNRDQEVAFFSGLQVMKVIFFNFKHLDHCPVSKKALLAFFENGDHQPSTSSSSLSLSSTSTSSSRSTSLPSSNPLLSRINGSSPDSSPFPVGSASSSWQALNGSVSLEMTDVLPRIRADRIRSPDSPKCDPTGVVDSSHGFPGSSSISSLGVVREKSISSVAGIFYSINEELHFIIRKGLCCRVIKNTRIKSLLILTKLMSRRNFQYKSDIFM